MRVVDEINKYFKYNKWLDYTSLFPFVSTNTQLDHFEINTNTIHLN